MNKLKIAHVVCTFPPYRGGIGNSAYNFAQTIAEQGHDVTVFTPRYSIVCGGLEAIIRKKGYDLDKFRIIRLRPLYRYGNAACLPQLIWKLNNFDIVHFHYPFYGSAEIIALKKFFSGKKMKLIVHYHMDAVAKGFKGFIFSLYKIFILPILIKQAKVITCASLDYVKHSQIEKYYKKHPNKFRQTLFGVSLNQFVVYRDHKNKSRKNKIILFVGGLDRAHYFKGLDNLFKAVKILKNEIKEDLILNVIGEGDLKPNYRKLARDLDLNKEIHFQNKIDNSKLVDFYNYCDVFVLPSINRGEAFGLVLLEAMACAKPVIASNLPGVRSVFKNNKHGFLIKPGDIKDLAKKLKIILLDKKLGEKMGQAGRSFVEKKYTWEKVGHNLNEIYYYVKYSP